MSKVEGIIFDWAGTTVDYGCFAPVQAFLEAFEQYGIRLTKQEVREPMGMLKMDHIRTIMNMERVRKCWNEVYGRDPDEQNVQEIYQIFEPKLLQILDNYAQPKPYVLETVKKLREKGIKIGSTTGYTDEMMNIVSSKAKEAGYEPDACFTPDATNHFGRPYPYMIFKNMQALNLSSVDSVIKIGDTVSDIEEGKCAGVRTIGVIEGSSEMGLTQEEYEALSEAQKQAEIDRVTKIFKQAGADAVILNMKELEQLV